MIEILFSVVVLAFILEFVDSTLGMGYGTTLTPVLLLMGYEPLAIVPAILLSEAVTGGLAAFLHHKSNNVDLRPGSQEFKVAAVLAGCSLLGVFAAVFLAISLPAFWLKLYIGLVVFAMGLLILLYRNKTRAFSWRKVVAIGAVAAFNKGASGGGYGPLVTSGQMLSGVRAKAAVGITSFAESFTSIAGVAAYFIASTPVDWALAPSLVTGAVLSVPLSVYVVKKMPEKNLRLVVGLATLLLGAFTLYKLFA